MTRTFAPITKLFHWLTALLILAIIPLGVVANRLPYETSEQLAFKAQLFSFHKTLGVAVFFVALLRIIWALTHPRPGTLHPDRKAETLLAETIHWVLYISLMMVPLTGWIDHAATSGFAPIWWPFGQSLPFVPKSEAVAGVFSGLHWIFGKLMVASLLLHIAGALKHHFIDKDATLRRMWFGKSNSPDVAAHGKSGLAAPIAFAAFIAAGLVAYGTGLLVKGEGTQAAALAEVSSEWTVQSGAIEITITQFGSGVTGAFENWTANISFDPDTNLGSLTTQVAIGSLTLGSVTDQAMGADFFDVETHPTATFEGDIAPVDGTLTATGTLTLKGETLPVTFPFELITNGTDAQMAGQLTLQRLDFGVGESMGDESSLAFAVDVAINVNATKAP